MNFMKFPIRYVPKKLSMKDKKKQVNMIIKSKIPTYEGIKESSLYLKEISSPGDIVESLSNSQISYYAERMVADPRMMPNGTLSMDITFETFLEQISIPYTSPLLKYLGFTSKLNKFLIIGTIILL